MSKRYSFLLIEDEGGIPIPPPHHQQELSGLKNLFTENVTIYNDIPADTVNPRRWKRQVVNRCNIQGNLVQRMNGNIVNVVNAKSVVTKDVDKYKNPIEYDALPEDEKEDYFTVRTGDFVVFGIVEDVVASSADYAKLQTKYKDNGIKVVSVSVNIYNLNADNIMMTNN